MHPERALDDRRDPPQRPALGGEPGRRRPAAEQAQHLLPLARAEIGLPTRGPTAPQAAQPLRLEPLFPVRHRRTTTAHLTANPGLEKLPGPHHAPPPPPASFH